MLPYQDMEYHPTSEKLVKLLCHKTQQTDPMFFRILVAYYFSMVASQMRCTIASPDRGDIPVNMYALNLAPSGLGKGLSTNVMEEDVIGQFKERFINETFPLLAEINLPKVALKRANKKQTDPDSELEKVQQEFNNIGPLMFSFCEASSPAIKQMRHILLLANAGSMNLEIDEIGLNLSACAEALSPFLELYDKGKIKNKLIKSTSDNKRLEEVAGNTPTNLMMFGAPVKLFDGAQTEQQLTDFLDTGYARRCFFGYLPIIERDLSLTAEEIYNLHTSDNSSQFLEQLSDRFYNLADIINVNRRLVMEKDTCIALINYRMACEREAAQLPAHEEMRKAELSHRYFKAMKLAGAYAFVDDSPELTLQHLYNAIKLAEASGEAFTRMMNQDKPYMKLAKYIASVKNEVTQADLVETLPFYKGSAAQKADLLTLAISYGYKNNIVIKKSFNDGIEYLRGETLDVTDLNRMIVAYSTDITTDYRNEYAPFDQLHKLMQAPGMHWVSHHLNGGYRNEENCIAGFNLVAIDVDGGVKLETVKALLAKYKYLIYTTKRHTEEEHRFRLLLPLNYTLKLDAPDFKEFMSNIYDWLPFEVDDVTNQRARKWMSHQGHYEYNDGELLDALPFIPKTRKNEERKQLLTSQQSMDNLERWVINNTGDGNRNNMILRYALLLVDAGLDVEGIRSRIISLNEKLPDKLDEVELMTTVMVTVAKAIAKRP